MRSTDQQVHSVIVNVNNASTQGPGYFVVSSGAGLYNFYAIDRGARIVGVTPAPAPGAQQASVQYALQEPPPRVLVTFYSNAGAAGSYGGSFTVQYRKMA